MIKYLFLFFSSVCLASENVGGYLSCDFTFGKDYEANSVFLSLSPFNQITFNAQFSQYFLDSTSHDYSLGFEINNKNKSLGCAFDYAFYTEDSDYKAKAYFLALNISHKKTTGIKLGFSNKTHSQHISLKKQKWFDLEQREWSFEIRQRIKRPEVLFSIASYSYNKDIKRLVEAYRWRFIKNPSLGGVFYRIAGFPEYSLSVGLSDDVLSFLSISLNWTLINYLLDVPKTDSYLLGLTFYLPKGIEFLPSYNYVEEENYFTIGLGKEF